jgi:hypothetical protein
MSFFHSPNTVTNGLVLAWDAANPKSYPGSGTTIYDLSGNGNHGTLNNGVGFSTNYKGILTFDGTNDYVRSDTPNLSATTSTIMGAARYSGGTRGRMINATNNNWLIGHWNNSTENYYAEGWVSPVQYGTSDTAWRIVTALGNVGTDNYASYINGVISATSTGGSQGPYGISIGAQTYGGTTEFSTGEFSFLLVYNRVLTSDEITQNYNALKTRFQYQYSEGNNAAPYVANWNNTTTYTMNQFGGLGKVNAHGFSSGPVTYTLTLSSLPVHTEVRYKVFWHLVDSLDNETNQLFTMNSSGGETEKLRFTKQYNLEPAISVQDTGVIAPWSGHQTYTYRPWAGGAYGQDGYLSIDTGWYSHTANSFTARHVMGADQGQTDEAEYLSHVQVYLR